MGEGWVDAAVEVCLRSEGSATTAELLVTGGEMRWPALRAVPLNVPGDGLEHCTRTVIDALPPGEHQAQVYAPKDAPPVTVVGALTFSVLAENPPSCDPLQSCGCVDAAEQQTPADQREQARYLGRYTDGESWSVPVLNRGEMARVGGVLHHRGDVDWYRMRVIDQPYNGGVEINATVMAVTQSLVGANDIAVEVWYECDAPGGRPYCLNSELIEQDGALGCGTEQGYLGISNAHVWPNCRGATPGWAYIKVSFGPEGTRSCMRYTLAIGTDPGYPSGAG